MDMKLRGMYIARQLSFHGVSFKIEEVTLSDDFIKVYDDSVKLVSTLCPKSGVKLALNIAKIVQPCSGLKLCRSLLKLLSLLMLKAG